MFSFRRQEAADPQASASAIPDHVIERPRRGSVMSLSQTLYSLDSSPPPADLEQIHASSSQAPGLTTFSLASPPGGSTEQLSLNRLYSRVKRVAAAVRDVVGVPGGEGGNRSRISIGSIGSERYRGHADSRDSFISSATVDSEDLGMPTSPLSPIKSHFSRHSIIASTSSLTPVSRVSSNNSMTSTTVGGDYAPPTALRKVNLRAAGAPVPSLAPVTAFRDGDGSGFISLASPGLGVARISDVSRNNSEANLQNSVKEAARPSKSTVNVLLGTAGAIVAGTVGYPPVLNKGDQDDRNVRRDEDEERFNCSMSEDEDAISDSSDDDVVLLNSRLPGGHDSDKPRARGNKPSQSIKVAGPSSDNQTFQKSRNKDNSSVPAPLNISNSNHLPPSATGSDVMTGSSSDSNGGVSFGNSPLVSPSTSPAAAAKSTMGLPPQGDKLSPAYVHQQMQQANVPGQLPLSLPNVPMIEPARKKRPPMVPRITTDQGNLLPGFSITREESSESGSSHGATSTADIGKRSGGSSVYQDRDYQDHREFQNDGMVNTGPNGGAGTGNSEAVSQALRQLRMGNLTNDFWMKDEVCKECFLCANTFSVFRRKHHCRLCGQIFCSKCTTLISGDRFGHQGSMRVCSPCLEIVNEYQDESESEDDFSPASVFHIHQPIDQRHEAISGSSSAVGTPIGDPMTPGFSMPRDARPATTPLMAIPASRITAGSNPNRRSQILEINAELPSPPRPGSSRSGKSHMAFSRPLTANALKLPQHGHSHSQSHTHSHHHHHKHQHSRSHRWLAAANVNERAPFHRNLVDELGLQRTLPAFHSDSIIDPDLAPYMSDEASDDEQMSTFATIAPKHVEGFGNMFSTSVMGSQNGQGSVSGGVNVSTSTKSKIRRAASISGISAILAGTGSSDSGKNGMLLPTRSSRKRNSSFMGNIQPRPVTRGKGRNLMRSLVGSVSDSSAFGGPGNNAMPSPRASRSASMRGPLAPSIELNTASLQHVRTLLRQLLSDANIKEVDKWERALMPILLKSTDDLNPDVRMGDDIDIRHYVKVKRIPGGKPSDTTYVSGVVFAKNLALKSMPRSVTQPRIVVVTFPIEYQRHQQQLMSLEPVIAQEKDFLQKMVNRILSLRPTLLLVEKNISGVALQLLAQANVPTTYLVKPSVTEAVARCAQADICSSVDKLMLPNFRVGRCASFDVRTFVHHDIPGRKKTFMYLSGCPKELGCTIVLRGGDMATLAVVKQITEMMVYVVYNLKLETCLMRDEFVNIPSSASTGIVPVTVHTVPPPIYTPITASLPTDPEESPVTKGDTEQVLQNENMEKPLLSSPEGAGSLAGAVPDDIPMPTYYEDMVRNHETKVLSASPFVKYMQPYLLMRARELERRLVYLRRLRDSQVVEEDEVETEFSEKFDEKAGEMEKQADERPLEQVEHFELIQPEMVDGNVKNGTKKMVEVLRAIHDAEYDKAFHVYETQKKQWENYLSQYDDLFDPYAHQNIAILYSLVCTTTSVPCEGPDIRRLEFYFQGMDWSLGKSDCTLGQYVELLCDTANKPCSSDTCDKKMIDHHRSYVHGQARVSVLVSDKMACPIQGMQDTILMWSYCKVCPNTNTPAIPMSESTWKYSFGKYLELAFWSSEMKLRAGTCPHDLNRDHVRCFGYRGLTVVFQYDPIDLLEIVVPRTKITYKPEIDLRIKNEQYLQHEERTNRFFSSVKSRLRSINIESVAPNKVEACKAEIEALTAQAETEHNWLIKKLQEKYNKSKYFEIIPLNRALRALQERVVDWDGKFSAFDNNYFPSEKDIRRLATLQLKKIFIDNPNPPTPNLQSDNERAITLEKEDIDKAASIDGSTELVTSPAEMSSKRAHDVLASMVEEDIEDSKEKSADLEPAEKVGDNEYAPSINNITPETTSRQERFNQLESTEDISPKQEILLEQEAAIETPKATSPEPPSEPNSPTATIHPKNKSSAALVEGEAAKSEGDTSNETVKQSGHRLSLERPSTGSHTSSIPRLVDTRRKGAITAPPMDRTYSVPSAPQRKSVEASTSGFRPPVRTQTTQIKKPTVTETLRKQNAEKAKADKKTMDPKHRLGSLSGKQPRKETQIPRSVPGTQKRKDVNKVTSLAKHFEQLSREFEKERARQKHLTAAKRTRALPVATSRPIVEVYRNVREAVEEASDEEPPEPTPPTRDVSNMTESTESTIHTESPQEFSPSEVTSTPGEPTEEEHVEEMGESIVQPGHSMQSDVEMSDGETLPSDHEHIPPIMDLLPPTSETRLDSKVEIPRHEKSAWMKMLSNFWAERSASGWSSLEYPLHPTDHVFNDSDVIVREDEPSSLIAFALNCEDYAIKLDAIRSADEGPTSSEDCVRPTSFNIDEHPELERSLLKPTGTHLKYRTISPPPEDFSSDKALNNKISLRAEFQEGSAKMFCKIFYAEQFDALRRNCGVADRYVESLSRCIKWDSKGGKTKSVFLKTQDERFVLKALSPIETAAFIKFAPAYFQFMAEAFFHELPTVIAKMLGFYQIMIKNPTTGTEIKWDVLVMENLFYDRKTTRIFDLKGSMRNRYTQSTGDQNEVLLDENMVEFIYESPLFVREHSKKLLRASLWNDTLFLSRNNVMDYSLMIGIDEVRKELCVGIIDCIRTFTWDKKLESWVKEKGFAGGGGKKPTVTSPREYKHRFREAMERYVLEAPSCWHLFRMNYMGTVPVLHHPREVKESLGLLDQNRDDNNN